MEKHMKTAHNGPLIALMTLTTLSACAPATDCEEQADCETTESTSTDYVQRSLASDLRQGLDRLERANGAIEEGDPNQVDPSQSNGLEVEADEPVFSELNTMVMTAEHVDRRNLTDSLRILLYPLGPNDTEGNLEQTKAVTGPVMDMAVIETCAVRGALVGVFSQGLFDGAAIEDGVANEVQIEGKIFELGGLGDGVFEGVYNDLEDSRGTLMGTIKTPGLDDRRPFSVFQGNWGEQSSKIDQLEGSLSGIWIGEDNTQDGVFVGYWSVCNDNEDNEDNEVQRDDAQFDVPNERPDIVEKP
jgi:hypothetical protein